MPLAFLSTLGQGEFGKVKLALHLPTQALVAVKAVRRSTLTAASRKLRLDREVAVLTTLTAARTPHVVALHSVVASPRHVLLVLQYAPGGELFDYILARSRLTSAEARRLFAQLLRGLRHIHAQGIVHRDLKLENLLLDADRNLLISDFGFAYQFPNVVPPSAPTPTSANAIAVSLLTPAPANANANANATSTAVFPSAPDTLVNVSATTTPTTVHNVVPSPAPTINPTLLTTSCGSPCYAGPELVMASSYVGQPADMWSCGVLLFAMLAGYLPWDDDVENPDGENVGRLYQYILNTPLNFPPWISQSAQSLISSLLVADPEKRGTMEQTIRHPWMSEYLASILATEVVNKGPQKTVAEISADYFEKNPHMSSKLLLKGITLGQGSSDSLIGSSALSSTPSTLILDDGIRPSSDHSLSDSLTNSDISASSPRALVSGTSSSWAASIIHDEMLCIPRRTDSLAVDEIHPRLPLKLRVQRTKLESENKVSPQPAGGSLTDGEGRRAPVPSRRNFRVDSGVMISSRTASLEYDDNDVDPATGPKKSILASTSTSDAASTFASASTGRRRALSLRQQRNLSPISRGELAFPRFSLDSQNSAPLNSRQYSKLKVYSGLIDRKCVSSRAPSSLMVEIEGRLRTLGIETIRVKEWKLKCVRRVSPERAGGGFFANSRKKVSDFFSRVGNRSSGALALSVSQNNGVLSDMKFYVELRYLRDLRGVIYVLVKRKRGDRRQFQRLYNSAIQGITSQ